jgi:hypothetical protein
VKGNADPATDQGPGRSDQDLLDDLYRLEAALGEDLREDLGAPEPAAGEVDAHAA